MRSFKIDDHSSDSFNTRIAGTVAVPVAEQVVEDIEVIGRAGTLTRINGWKDLTITVPLLFMKPSKQVDYRRLASSLQNARTLALSHELGKFRRLKYASLSSLVLEGASWGACTLTATCQPFTYHQLHRQTLSTSGSTTVNNPGLLEAKPRLQLTGRGTLTFTLNGAQFSVSSPAGQVTLDSELLTAHTGSTAQLATLPSQFPVLRPGANTFSLSGGSGVTGWSVEVNWRDP